MTTIVLRADNPSGLSIAQIDGNFTNLNNDKVEKTDTLYLGTTGITYNRASNPLSVSGFDIAASGVRADSAPNGKILKLVDGVSAWADEQSDSALTASDDTTTNETYYPLLISALTGEREVHTSSSKLYFNPFTGHFNATHFNSLSDQSLKLNRIQVTNAVSTVNDMCGVEFNWKDTGEKSSGVIAQELEKILPHLVSENNQGLKSVNYIGIIAYLIEAVKELDARVKSIEDK
jgi:hypothetical protein